MDDLFALAIATLGLLIVAGIAFAVGHAYGRTAAERAAIERRIHEYGQDAGA